MAPILIRLEMAVLRTAPYPLWVMRKSIALGRVVRPGEFSDADPFKILRVDPRHINHYGRHVPTRWGRVQAGDWDRRVTPITNHVTYKSVVQRFRDGVPWERTPAFEKRVRQIETSGMSKGCRTRDDLLSRLREVDKIYQAMQLKGFLTQAELIRQDPDGHRRLFYKEGALIHPSLDEIIVTIGRNGEYIHHKHGRHRLFIAGLLNLDTVPVLVGVRHRAWQELRNRVRRVTSLDELSPADHAHLNHPDLADIGPAPA